VLLNKGVQIPEGEQGGEEISIRERMAKEELVKERIDEEGNRWTKVYFGGGQHFENWMKQRKTMFFK